MCWLYQQEHTVYLCVQICKLTCFIVSIWSVLAGCLSHCFTYPFLVSAAEDKTPALLLNVLWSSALLHSYIPTWGHKSLYCISRDYQYRVFITSYWDFCNDRAFPGSSSKYNMFYMSLHPVDFMRPSIDKHYAITAAY